MIEKILIEKDYYNKPIYPSKKDLIDKINELVEALNKLNNVSEADSSR